MKIQLASDLHLEFYNDNDLFDLYNNDCLALVEDTGADVLLLAGDVTTPGSFKYHTKFFDTMCNRFKTVVYITGNHEYYNGDIINMDADLKNFSKATSNLFVLTHENSFKVSGTLFVGGTLWTDFMNEDQFVMQQAYSQMNDYRLITMGGTYFSPMDSVNLFHKFLSNIEATIEDEKGNYDKLVVMTHHAPHPQSISAKYVGNELNGAYFTDLRFIMNKHKPDLWVHGHVHSSFDYAHGSTRIVCNPFGYLGYETNMEYSSRKVIEL